MAAVALALTSAVLFGAMSVGLRIGLGRRPDAALATLATVVGAFLLGWPSLIAVILNYVKRSEARGTWLDSHFRWQIRTFWYGLLWVSLCMLFIVMTLGVGILIAWIPLGAVGLWFIYRIARGWLALVDRRPMYVVL